MADWDSFSARFDDTFLEDPMYLDVLEKMVNELAEDGKREILDLGCGTGNLIERILKEVPEARIAGVDPSEGMREICAERFVNMSNVTISEGDALAIPFPDSRFDHIVSSFALHHVPPHLKGECAREMARVLKPGGSLIHADPFCGLAGSKEDPERCRDIIDKVVAKALFSLEHGAYEMMIAELYALPFVLREDGEYLVTVEEWIGALASAGFRDLRVIDIEPIDWVKIVCARH